MVGWGILFIAIFLAIFGTMVQMWKGLPKWIVAVCATIVSLSVSVAGSYLYENLKPFLPPISNTTSSDGMTKQDMGESNDIMQNEELPGQNTELSDGNSDFDNTNFEETMPDTAENESTESEDRQESPSYDTEPETTYSNETVLNTGVEATKENISPLYNIEDIAGVSTVTGKIKNEGQKNRYKFTSGVNGVYRFDSDLSAGGSVKIRIS